jgi:hypothetical protein
MRFLLFYSSQPHLIMVQLRSKSEVIIRSYPHPYMHTNSLAHSRKPHTNHAAAAEEKKKLQHLIETDGTTSGAKLMAHVYLCPEKPPSPLFYFEMTRHGTTNSELVDEILGLVFWFFGFLVFWFFGFLVFWFFGFLVFWFLVFGFLLVVFI